MISAEVIDEHFIARYRALLDAEDAAFDELEHCYEDGDRAHWATDVQAWQSAVHRRIAYLNRCQIDLGVVDLTMRT